MTSILLFTESNYRYGSTNDVFGFHHFSPILRNGLKADLERTYNFNFAAVSQRRQNEGCNRDFGDWCNTLAMKNKKVF